MPTIDLPLGEFHYCVAGPDNSTQPPVIFAHGMLVGTNYGVRWPAISRSSAFARTPSTFHSERIRPHCGRTSR